MKVEKHHLNEDVLETLNLFISHLYGDVKPAIYNRSDIDMVYMVTEADRVKGFLTLYENPDYPGVAFIGNYQCEENEMISSLLLSQVAEDARYAGKKKIIGPMNGNTWFPYRFTKPNSHPSFFLEHIHKPYYFKQWKTSGYVDEEIYRSNRETEFIVEGKNDIDSFFLERNIEIIPLKEVALFKLYEFCSSVFSKNVLFSKISYESFSEIYKPLIEYGDDQYSDIVIDQGGDVVGLFFAAVNPLNTEQVVVKTIARHPADVYKGLATILSSRLLEKLRETSVKEIIHAYFHMGNRSQLISKNFQGEFFKEHVLLSLQL